jgi:hypothetical protein
MLAWHFLGLVTAQGVDGEAQDHLREVILVGVHTSE